MAKKEITVLVDKQEKEDITRLAAKNGLKPQAYLKFLAYQQLQTEAISSQHHEIPNQ